MSKLTDRIAICDRCGEVIEKRPYYINRAKRHYCNMKCRSGARMVSVKCDTCGKELSRSIYQAGRGPLNFCNETCRNVWHSEFMTGKQMALKKEEDKVDYRIAQRVWTEKNKEIIKEQKIKYYKENKNHICKRAAKYRREVYLKTPNGSILNKLRSRTTQAIKSKGLKKTIRTMELVGCSLNELKLHLQKTAADNGYCEFDINSYSGREYHIDHIKPCSCFDLTKEDNQRECFHYTNLQILTAKENLFKNNKIAC